MKKKKCIIAIIMLLLLCIIGCGRKKAIINEKIDSEESVVNENETCHNDYTNTNDRKFIDGKIETEIINDNDEKSVNEMGIEEIKETEAVENLDEYEADKVIDEVEEYMFPMG